MATTPKPAPYQPTNDDDARTRAAQILGSDTDHTWTGDWHKALKEFAAAQWPTDQPAPQPAPAA